MRVGVCLTHHRIGCHCPARQPHDLLVQRNPQAMTPTQFKDARKALSLSQNAMAEALGLKTSRAIRQFESGDREVSGPVAKLVAMLLEQAK